YLLSDDGLRLTTAASFGTPTTNLEYALKEQSLATQVFNTQQGVFVPDPRRSGVMSQRGVQMAGITSPVVGVPLVFQEKSVGALVAWHNRKPERVHENLVQELEPFTRIAAATIALLENSRRRSSVLARYLTVQQEINKEDSDLEKNLDCVMRAIQD